MMDANFWIKQLGLKPHPEGGHFRETYRSPVELSQNRLQGKFTGSRSVSTAIYLLLQGTEISTLHRIKSDEIWHYYAGSSLTIHVISENCEYKKIALGLNGDQREVHQAVISAGCWFGATVNDPSSYTLAGCTVAPGFDFQDFELGQRGELTKEYPQHKEIIERLTED